MINSLSPVFFGKNIIFAAVLMLLISGIQQNYARKQIRNNLERTAEMELIIKAIVIRNSVEDVSLALRNRSWEFEKFLPYPDSLFAVTRRIVEQNPNFAGCCIAMVPNYYPEKGRLFEPYTLRRGEVIGDMAAIVGVDLSTEWMGDLLNARHIFPSSYNILLSGEGRLICGPNGTIKSKDVEQIMGLINDSTGYCNAGHDKPFVIGKEIEQMPAKPHLPLGVMDDLVYSAQETAFNTCRRKHHSFFVKA